MFSKYSKSILYKISAAIILIILSQWTNWRYDFTKDKRYTLSSTTEQIVKDIKQPVNIEIYLEGKFPASFLKLQQETKQLLDEYRSKNPNIHFQFVDPLNCDEKNQLKTAENLYKKGIKPLHITVTDKGKQSQQMVFPWALAKSGQNEVVIPLIKNNMGMTTDETVNTSIAHLEYAITDALKKATTAKSKKIAILKGIGEPADIEIADLLLSLRQSYYIAPFVMDSVANNPQKTLSQLKTFDLIMVNKPFKTFSDAQLQVLDQYIINGGKAMFFIDNVQADLDSLKKDGTLLAYPKDLSLSNLLFKYGVRVNAVLVKDEVGAPLRIAIGKQGSQTKYDDFIWKFSPFSVPTSQHPIVKNIEGVRFDFANSIDTLKNKIKKTVLLQSSPYSKTIGTPTQISLQMLNEPYDVSQYQEKGNIPLAVLVEGNFTSMYNNRILPFEDQSFKNHGKYNKIIVVADGDVVRNQLDENLIPLELGYDKWTNKLYGNKEFVLNSVNYLIDDAGLMALRTKDFKLPLLDKEKVYKDYRLLQTILVLLPIVILSILSILFIYYRKNKYGK